MKGRHEFENQIEALACFIKIVLKTTHNGAWFADIEPHIRRLQSEFAGRARDFWLGECKSIVPFFIAQYDDTDALISKRYEKKINVSSKRTNPVICGFLEWRCERLKNGYLCLLFDKAGDAAMYYDLGKNSGNMKPRLLGLPFEGDRLFDLSPGDFRALVEELKKDVEF